MKITADCQRHRMSWNHLGDKLLGTPVEVLYSRLVSRYTMPGRGWKAYPYGWQHNSLGMDPGWCKQEKTSSAPIVILCSLTGDVTWPALSSDRLQTFSLEWALHLDCESIQTLLPFKLLVGIVHASNSYEVIKITLGIIKTRSISFSLISLKQGLCEPESGTPRNPPVPTLAPPRALRLHMYTWSHDGCFGLDPGVQACSKYFRPESSLSPNCYFY